MNSKVLKNVQVLFALLLVVVVLSSCNRGGTGCPYELEAATNVLTNLIK